MRIERRFIKRKDGTLRGPYYLLRYNLRGRRKSIYVKCFIEEVLQSKASCIKLQGESAEYVASFIMWRDPEFTDEDAAAEMARLGPTKRSMRKKKERKGHRKIPIEIVELLKSCGFTVHGSDIHRSKSKYYARSCAAARFSLLPVEAKAAIGSAGKYLKICRKAESLLKASNRRKKYGCKFENLLNRLIKERIESFTKRA